MSNFDMENFREHPDNNTDRVLRFLTKNAGFNEKGDVFVKVQAISSFLKDACLSIDFNKFKEIVSGHIKALDQEFKNKFPLRKFDKAEDIEKILHFIWEEIYGKAVETQKIGKPQLLPAATIQTNRTNISQQIKFVFLPNGSGREDRFTLTIKKIDGDPITSIHPTAGILRKDPEGLKGYARNLLLETLDAPLKEAGINLTCDSREINTLATLLSRGRTK